MSIKGRFSLWLSHHLHGFHKSVGSCSSSPALAGMSHVSIIRQHLPCSGVPTPDVSDIQSHSPLSLRSWVCHQPIEVGSCPISGYAPFGSSEQHIVCPFPDRLQNLLHIALELCKLSQLLARQPALGRRVDGIMLPHSAAVHVSPPSSVDAPGRPLRHAGRSATQADFLVIPSSPVFSATLVSSCSSGRSCLATLPYPRPNVGRIQLRKGRVQFIISERYLVSSLSRRLLPLP